mgnify:CR=1 FL=1
MREHAAVVEVRLLSLGPAAEHVIHRHQADIGKFGFVFGGVGVEPGKRADLIVVDLADPSPGVRRHVGATAVGAARHVEDLAGDRARDPALRRLAQHHRLRVEPASLVQQPAEAALKHLGVIPPRLVAISRA